MSDAPATQAQLRRLVHLLADTGDCENDCDRLLQIVAVWLETVTEQGHRPLPESLAFVPYHLELCPKCLIEVNAMLAAHRESMSARRRDGVVAGPPKLPAVHA